MNNFLIINNWRWAWVEPTKVMEQYDTKASTEAHDCDCYFATHEIRGMGRFIWEKAKANKVRLNLIINAAFSYELNDKNSFLLLFTKHRMLNIQL